jgi:transposase
VEVVARDRADVYADGARRGAPEALHVADRWHLLKNLGDAVRAAAGAHHAAIRRAGRAVAAELAAAPGTPPAPTALEARKAATHAARRAPFEEVRRLHGGGASINGVSRVTGLDRKTIRKWLREGGPGTWERRTPEGRAGIPGPWSAHLERRWGEGLRNGAALWRELAAAGYPGGRATVKAWVTRRRRAAPDALSPTSASDGWTPPTANGVARLLQRKAEDLDGPSADLLAQVTEEVPALGTTRDLALRFAALVRKEGTGTLACWLDDAEGTPLAGFAKGLRKDLGAVRAALELPWSTSPVEGQISRLKTIKRTMYGRAGFGLLRSRVLAAA